MYRKRTIENKKQQAVKMKVNRLKANRKARKQVRAGRNTLTNIKESISPLLEGDNRNTKVLNALSSKLKAATNRRKRELVKSKFKFDSKKRYNKTLPIKKLIEPPAFTRMNCEKELGSTFEFIAKPDRVRVAAIEGTEYYVLIDGLRRYQYLKNKKESEIRCKVVGEAECVSQVSAARAKEMSKQTKPLSKLELCLGVSALKDQLFKEFGEDAFFSHGGDRKRSRKKKKKLIGYISELTKINEWAVDQMVRFARILGPEALVGLQSNAKFKINSFRNIRDINEALKKHNVQGRLQDKLEGLSQSKVKKADRISMVGDMAYELICEVKMASKRKKRGKKRKAPSITSLRETVKDFADNFDYIYDMLSGKTKVNEIGRKKIHSNLVKLDRSNKLWKPLYHDCKELLSTTN